MSRDKVTNLEVLILELLKEKPEVRLSDVADAAGLSHSDEADRKAIRRVLNRLIKSEVLTTQGDARARVYLLKKVEENAAVEQKEVVGEFPLTKESRKLMDYLLKPIHARTPVGYNLDYLKSYEPNHTAYLSTAHRAALLSLGTVENVVHFAGTYARNILNRLLIDLSWNSSRLEGNTYSLLETKRLIELGENAVGKDASEAQMILNHKNAIEYIVDSADESTISSLQVCSIHALLSENLLGDPSATGRLRKIAVGISGTTYLPLENPHQIKEYFDIFIQKLNGIDDPFEQSLFSMVHLSYLQAFEDVNKRTARLVANIPLIKKNLQPLSFMDVDRELYFRALLGIYEKNDSSLLRDLYIWAYKRSVQRYSATQQAIGESNFFKMKYRNIIHDIVRTIILEKVEGSQVVSRVRTLIAATELTKVDASLLFQTIETEILSLHEANIARFKIRPSEFQEWKRLQTAG